eukprot:7390124-Prymnesium_polylepis.3
MPLCSESWGQRHCSSARPQLGRRVGGSWTREPSSERGEPGGSVRFSGAPERSRLTATLRRWGRGSGLGPRPGS